jgi:hypothetical protein
MRSTAAKCIVAGALAAFIGNARAAEQGACKADVQKLCKDVQPGEGKIVECMKTHQKELSPKCASQMKQVQAGLKQVSNACESDVEKFCWDTPMGKGGIASCLKKHTDELSSECKDAVAKAKAGMKK